MAKVYLEPNEVDQLENAVAYLRDKLLIRLLFHLGCRISEALALKVGDIDFDQGTITIEHLKTRLKLSCPKCRARLSKNHKFCPTCGHGIEETLAQELEHRRVRTLPIDRDTELGNQSSALFTLTNTKAEIVLSKSMQGPIDRFRCRHS